MVGWYHQLKGYEFEYTPGEGVGQGSLVCCSPWVHKESDKTEQLNNMIRQSTGLQGNANILYDITMLAIYHYTFVQAH